MGEFDLPLRYIKDKENVVADSQSRLFIDEEIVKADEKSIEDRPKIEEQESNSFISHVRMQHRHGTIISVCGSVSKCQSPCTIALLKRFSNTSGRGFQFNSTMETTAQATHKRGSSQATTESVSQDDGLLGVQDVKDVYCMETSTTASQTPEMLEGMPKVGLGVGQTYEAETGLKTSGGVGAEGGVGCDKSQNYKYSGKPNSVGVTNHQG
jgi:hypothetical protein